MQFSVNDSPFCGKDGGRFLTSNHLADRLEREAVARVIEAEQHPDADRLREKLATVALRAPAIPASPAETAKAKVLTSAGS